jgi:hypothetical protein
MRAAAAAAAALLAAGPASADPARTLYMLHCQGCHLADGSGSPGEVPSLAGSLGRFLDAPGGRAFLVQVPGAATSALSDAELALVLNWMVRAFGPADAAERLAPYDAAEVARLRASPLADVASVRAELVRWIAAGSALTTPAP